MSHSVHIISKGYGPPDGRCLPCSGVSGRAIAAILPSSSRCHHKLLLSHSHVKFLSSLRCSSTHKSIVVCNANSSSYRRNPDLPRQNNKQGFSRNNRNNRPNGEKRDGFQDFEESENGSLLSVSGNHKFQATSTPGPREKEIVELFRKVQAQLRERAAMKEDKKVEVSQVKSKENETVDSLLKLLRKHSVQQGKRNTDTESSDFILDQPEQIVPSPEIEERSTKISNSNNHVKHEKQQVPSPNLSRPKSNFRKRSPVPEIKFQPIYTEGSVNSASHDSLAGRRKGTPFEPESNEIQKLKNEFDSELDESTFSEVNVLDEMSEYETSEIYEGDHDDVDEEQNQDETSKLNEMKLTELRALAKSRGLKGFSKLKKSELIDLLGDNSV